MRDKADFDYIMDDFNWGREKDGKALLCHEGHCWIWDDDFWVKIEVWLGTLIEKDGLLKYGTWWKVEYVWNLIKMRWKWG